ncbi:hypothetical protein ARMSODRAFT_1016181 [Armillaria solidipes]|uniref:Uncharacterized protein n=1 Tax=Armillaria solidipes TaxID=1076256 RepID=A0A2H3BMX0_9AGAR|nr:hypothetical protein ARMSODRAFT_1016181 [Armillaria solidipes]
MKAAESGKEEAAAKTVEAALIDEEKETDVDTKGEKLEVPAPVGPKRKWATKFSSVVEDSDKEGMPGPSKKVKVEVSGPTEGKEEFSGNSKEMYALPSRWGPLFCMTGLQKGNSSALTISSEKVLEVLQKLVYTVKTLANKMTVLTGQVVDLWSCVNDLVVDFRSEEINSPEELISDMEE